MSQNDSYNSQYKTRLMDLQNLLIKQSCPEDIIAIGKQGKQVMESYYSGLPSSQIIKVLPDLSLEQKQRFYSQGLTIKMNGTSFDVYAAPDPKTRKEEGDFKALLLNSLYSKGDAILISQGHKELFHQLAEIPLSLEGSSVNKKGEDIFNQRLAYAQRYISSNHLPLTEFLAKEREMHAVLSDIFGAQVNHSYLEKWKSVSSSNAKIANAPLLIQKDPKDELPTILQEYKDFLKHAGISEVILPSSPRSYKKGVIVGTICAAICALGAAYALHDPTVPAEPAPEPQKIITLEEKVEKTLGMGDLRLLESHLKSYIPPTPKKTPEIKKEISSIARDHHRSIDRWHGSPAGSVPRSDPALQSNVSSASCQRQEESADSNIPSPSTKSIRHTQPVDLRYSFSKDDEEISYIAPIWLLYPQEAFDICADTFSDLKSISSCIPAADRGLARERTDCAKKNQKIKNTKKRNQAIFDCISDIKDSEHKKAKKVLKQH